MTISFAVTNDLTNDQRMIRICTSLSQAGYDVQLIGRQLPVSQPLQEYGFRQKRLSCFAHSGKIFYLEYNIRLFFYLLTQKNEAVCAVDLDTILPVWAVTTLKHQVRIYDAHEYFTEVPEVIRRPRIKQIWEWIADFAIPKFDYCYTVGEELAKIFSERYHVDFQVIRNVALRSKSSYSKHFSGSDDKILLYQGALNEGRGLESAIEMMQHLEGYELWLAGEGDLSETLRKRVIAEALSSRVRFLGMLSPEELRQLTPTATLGLHFTENKGLSYYYSLANRTFDYLQAGVPAIHPDFPEYRALLRRYTFGELLRSSEPNHLAEQVRTICENSDYYQMLQVECLRAQADLCWEKEEKKLLNLYSLIKNNIINI